MKKNIKRHPLCGEIKKKDYEFCNKAIQINFSNFSLVSTELSDGSNSPHPHPSPKICKKRERERDKEKYGVRDDDDETT